MKLQMIGCSHHHSSVSVRERLAFTPSQVGPALDSLRQRFPHSEAVLLSTCNRVEIYTACEAAQLSPSHEQVAQFMADFHQMPLYEIFDDLVERTGEDAVRHLFTVAASLDSMVVGEPQILAQVKQAYETAKNRSSAGPLTHGIFQAAARVAKRVATETTLHQRRVSIPSVAVGDFAGAIFERFDDKQILVIGAGEMGEETLRYLQNEGAHHVTVINRSFERASQLAERWQGSAAEWSQLPQKLIDADLVISTTGAEQPVVSLELFKQQVEPARYQRPLFVLDLAVPRDFDQAIGDRLGVYLYSLDDLQAACKENLRQRDRELPGAIHIVEQETTRFMTELHHRTTAPIIKRLREGWQQPKDDELKRLFNKLPELDERAREEIGQAFDRLVNKLLHPPLESLRSEAENGPPHGLLEALKRLFQLKD
jgi:glutamyl-tRNA reductase